MAMLDNILDQLREYAQSRTGGMPWDQTPADTAAQQPQAQPNLPASMTYPTSAPSPAPGEEYDYSLGFPTKVLKKRKTATELEDADLQAAREAHPVPPMAMAAQQPVSGLLSPFIRPTMGGTVPPTMLPAEAGDGSQGAQPGAGPSGAPPIAPSQVPIPQPRPDMPAAGPAPVPTPAPAGPDTDVSARATTPPAPGPGAEAPGPGILGRIDQFTQRNPGLLFALASGFSGAPSFGTGMSKAFGAAPAGMAADRANQQFDIKQQGVSSTYKALLANGVEPKLALAAATNPAILAQIGPEYLASRKREIKTIKSKDAFGNETERMVSINPYDPNDVKEITGGAARGSADGGIAPGGKTSGMFAPGVTSENFNHNAVGEDYLNQFAPEPQAAIKDYLKGNTNQTGRQMPIQMIKMAAQKYGQDIGMPADDTALGQRKQFANSVADVKNGIGMQAKGFQQGLEHAVSLSDSLVKLGNSSGMGFEPAAEWINSAKNLTGSQTAIKNNIQAKSQALAGEVGKLYSGGTGGGVHERALTAQNLGKTSASPVAAAGGLEATIDLMEGGLRTLEQRRDQLFPNGDAPKGSQFRDAAQEAAMAHIRKNIAILKGEQQAEAAAPAAAAAPRALSGVSPSLKVPWSLVQ